MQEQDQLGTLPYEKFSNGACALNEHAFIQPVGNRILVLRDSFKYEGLLVIPDAAQRSGTTGIVVAIGDGDEVTSRFKLKDRVLFAHFTGVGLEFQNRPKYTLLNVDEIIAFVHSDDILQYTTT